MQTAIDRVNCELPHYRQVRNFVVLKEGFTPESGLLTANGKLRREEINTRFREEIEKMYKQHAAVASGNAG